MSMQLPRFPIHKYTTFTRAVVLLVLDLPAGMAYRAHGWGGLALGLGASVMWVPRPTLA